MGEDLHMGLLVSINCATYNHEEYIAEALEGFLMQKTDFNYEILIGEDCSTDKTRKIVEEYIEQYPDKIKMITSENNVGERINFIRLLENSKGKYIAVCEGDDFWIDPYKLQKQVDYMEGNPECTLCFHAADIVLVSKKKTGMKIKPYYQTRVSPIEDIISGGGGFCHTASLLYPRKRMKNPPSFFLTAHVGDYPIQLILASQGYAYYIDDCMSAYRTGVKGSWTSRQGSGECLRSKMTRIHEGNIQILTAFNKYTSLKHQESVSSAIFENEFAISIIRGKRKGQKINKYEDHINSLGFKKSLKIRLQYNYPKSYMKLTGLKKIIFNKRLFN